VSQVTDLSADRVRRLPAYGDLERGITANINSLRDAQALVRQMRQDVARRGTRA
jgi:hypothetical protein